MDTQPQFKITTMQAFLQLEEKLRLWSAEVGGVKLWPALREDVMVTLRNREQNITRIKPRATHVLRPHLWKLHAKTLAFLRYPNAKERYTTLIIQWSEDRIYRHFYQQLQNPLIIESSLFGRFDHSDMKKRKGETVLHDTLKILERLDSVIRPLTASEQHLIREFAQYVARAYELPTDTARFQNMITAHVQRYRFLRPIVMDKIIPQLTTRYAFVALASYMATKAALTQLLHEGGISIIEGQHGIINPNHVAYTLPPSSLTDDNHPSRQYLPDILLTFGEYWSHNAQTPSQKVIVGFPHLMNRLNDWLTHDHPDPQQILIISQWTISQRMVSIAKALAQSLPNYRIIYKLHPFEVNTPHHFTPLSAIPNIQVIGLHDVHELIAQCGIIVGYNSTVIFEALAFPHRRIFVLANDEIPNEIAHPFESVEELTALIRAEQKGYPQWSSQQCWADNPDERIALFLRQSGLLTV